MSKIWAKLFSKDKAVQLDLFAVNNPKPKFDPHYYLVLSYLILLVLSLLAGLTLPFYLANTQIPSKVLFFKAISNNEYFNIKLKGNTAKISQLTGLDIATLESLSLDLKRGSNSFTALSKNGLDLLAVKRDNQGISLSVDNSSFWNLSPNLRNWFTKNITSKDADQKIKEIFNDQWLNTGFLPTKKIEVHDFIRTSNGIDFTTDLASLSYLSNINILSHFLDTITKSKINYDPGTVFIVHVKIKDGKFLSLETSLSPLGLGDVSLLVSPAHKRPLPWESREVKIISQDFNQLNTTTKNVDLALQAILSNAQDIAKIKQSQLTPEILITSYKEIAKDADKSYTLSQAGGVIVSTKNYCRQLLIMDSKPIFASC